jgi:hypothetical protein
MRGDDLPIVIGSPRLGRVLGHWREACGERLIPSWQDIRPDRIKAELPIVWSYRYDPIQDDFLGGIAGDAIQKLLGGPIKNTQFRKLHAADPHLFGRAKEVLARPAIFFGRGLLFKQRSRQCYGERLMLPFAGKDGRACGIFGATDYKFSFLYASGPEYSGEVEHWFDLARPPCSLLFTRFESERHAISGAADVS